MAAKTGIPKEMFGTKTPSMISMWNQSASLLLIILQSRSKFPKSEASTEGAIIVGMNFFI
jgi:hypothetical protein